MPLCIDEIFLVSHAEKFLLHAPLHGVTALLSTDAAAELQRFLAHGQPQELSAGVRSLAQTLLDGSPIAPKPPTGAYAPRQIGLLPTNECNMHCLYCAVGAGSGNCSSMPHKICEAALRFQAEVVRREGYRDLRVAYFGGEPFVAWELVQVCDATGRELSQRLGVPFRVTADTNGYMPKEHASWIARHLDFVIVSLDGLASTHDAHRPSVSGLGTHAIVTRNLHVFEEEGLPYALRCSVDHETVKRLPEIAEYFCREFRPIKINFEPLLAQGRCLESGLRPPSPGAFVNAVVEAGRVARGYGVEIKLHSAQPEHLGVSNCPIASDHCVVTPDGLVVSCYSMNHRKAPGVAGYTLGEVDPTTLRLHIDPAAVERMRTYGVENIPRCRDCFCKWHCAGGCRLFQTRAFSKEPPGPLCLITQKLTLWKILQALRLYEEADRVYLDTEEVAYAGA